ncbi:MAG: hypothetical protein ACXVHD_21015 [Solirubrobacteraceae bacterium]
MSDSLNATVIVILLVFTISANEVDPPDELEEPEEPEPPRLPAVVPVPPLAEELDEDVLLELLDDVEPPVTESPGWRLASDTILPLIGAYSFVFASACSALCTLALALSTEASAEAMLPAEDVVVVELLAPDPPPVLAPDPPPELADGALVARGVVVVCGVVVVVVCDVVLVGFGVVVVVGVVVVLVGVVVVLVVVVVVRFLVWYVTNSVADELPVRLVLVALEPEDDASSAAVS